MAPFAKTTSLPVDIYIRTSVKKDEKSIKNSPLFIKTDGRSIGKAIKEALKTHRAMR